MSNFKSTLEKLFLGFVTSSKTFTSMQAKQDLAQMGTLAGNAGRKLSSMAQSFMKDLQGSY